MKRFNNYGWLKSGFDYLLFLLALFVKIVGCKKNLWTSALLCGAFFTAGVVFASTANSYKIDILIIENLSPVTTESFSQPVSLPSPAIGRRLTDSKSTRQNQTRLLPDSQHALRESGLGIRRSKGFRLLAQHSWITELNTNKDKTFIIPEVTDTERRTQLSGSISVRRGRFLHIKPDLLLTLWTEPKPVYFEQAFANIHPSVSSNNGETPLNAGNTPAVPLSPFATATNQRVEPERNKDPHQELIAQRKSGDQPGANNQLSDPNNPLIAIGLEPTQFYHLNYSRRMRSNELHYLDHPKLAMLVKIRATD